MEELNYKVKSHSPGFPVFTGTKKVMTPKVSIIKYNTESIDEFVIEDINKLNKDNTGDKVIWINVVGLHELSVIQNIGSIFSIHPLIIEDVVNVNHSPKIENYNDSLFAIAKMIDINVIKGVNIEQVSFFLRDNLLITFQEDEKDVFGIIRDRIRNNIGKIRTFGSDYLMYRLIDSIVDNYLLVLENYDDRLDMLDDKIMIHPDKVTISSIHSLRKELMKFRRAVMPLQEVLYGLEKDRVLKENTAYFLRDLRDHLKQVIESIESYQEMTNNLIEIYLSNSSFKMNEIIKVLTIISTIFIPLTFIVGIYGMNFDLSNSPYSMPELKWYYGYPAVMLFMLGIAIGLIFWFKKKKWL